MFRSVVPMVLACAMFGVSCGNDSEFRGGGITGAEKGKDAGETENGPYTSTDNEGNQVGVPGLANNGESIPVDSGTDHDELDLGESVVWGNDAVYRVGDGTVKGTSCMTNINAKPLSGTSYSFSFKVQKDNTTVQVKIATICGVDVNDYNTIKVVGPNGSVQDATLEAGQTEVVLSALMLAKGEYSIEINSTKILTGQYVDHFDDFIVGDIYVNANKKIIPGDVVAK